MTDRAERSLEQSHFQDQRPANFDLLDSWKNDRTRFVAQLEAPILPTISLESSPNLRAADVIARDTSGSKSILPALTIDGVEIAEKQMKVDPKFKDRGDAEEGFNSETARRLSQVLPNLAAYSERHEGIGPKLIDAIIRNEHSYYDLGDWGQDIIASHTGDRVMKHGSVGPGQVQIANIRDLQKKYPGLFADVDIHDLTRMATDKTFATALVAAYLDDRAKTLESWTKHPPDITKLNPDEKLLYRYSLPLWKSGQETKALISSFNPGDGTAHITNVLRQLRLIDQGN